MSMVCSKINKQTVCVAGELALLVTNITEDQSLVLSTHAWELITKPPVTPVPGDLMSSSGLCGHSCGRHSQRHINNSYFKM